MYKSSVLVLKLLADIMQHVVMVQGIIVERNLHAYYRLPTIASDLSTVNNNTEDYYLLQCPFKSNVNIPQPQDMPICTIIGRHYEETDEVPKPEKVDNLTKKTKAPLHTKVDYRPAVKPKHKVVKLIKVKKGKHYKMMLKPVKKKTVYHRPKSEPREKYKMSNVRVLIDNPKASSHVKPMGHRPAPTHPHHLHDSIALSSSAKPKVVRKSEPKLPPPQDVDFTDDSEESLQEAEDTASPLKYLGAREVLDKLQLQNRAAAANPSANSTIDKSEKFFAESKDFKKGFKTKFYQNMYHRDEIYQDHIFYDDLQQRGNYDVYAKSKEKFEKNKE